MDKILRNLKLQAQKEIKEIATLSELEALETRFLGRKSGRLNEILKNLKNLPENQRQKFGALANVLKKELQEIFDLQRRLLSNKQLEEKLREEWLDVTQELEQPWCVKGFGGLNPTTKVRLQIEDLFISLGFTVVDGLFLDSDYYNFESLNMDKDHPARDMQDTFYIKGHPHWLMRTHTSNVQVRTMQELGAPLKVISAGRCFRNEATDARHEHTFYQVEGFMVDEKVNYANLKYMLEEIAKSLFGSKTKIRFNPKCYPFVEPGFSGDVSCFLCQGQGCSVCKHTGWLEFFGAGMIHPQVLEAGHIPSSKYQGLAFGLGLSRLTMLKYNITDTRLINSSDLRFLKQF